MRQADARSHEGTSPLSGRIGRGPGELMDREVLGPQFRYEAAHLLPFYVLAEKVVVLEYLRMGLVERRQARWLAAALDAVDERTLAADPDTNFSDIAFAIERFVTARLPEPVPAWHVDRSRNDLQACAQLMFGRDQLARTAAELATCARAAHATAARHLTEPMPGYTHGQPAQVMTPGFYLAALGDHLVRTLRRLLAGYDAIGLCPLGAAAMTGPELDWDRDAMARLLGFTGAQPHPLVAVASRAWTLEVAAECSTFGITLSRFVTDLMVWGSREYGFIDLPDELSGISSAMPQKKNFPVLERIRGRTAHLTAWYLDCALAQRGTPFSNTVEAAKEGGAHTYDMLATLRSVLRLLTAVLRGIAFRPAAMRAVCEREHLGGFTLANQLTLDGGVPWRTAQVIAGGYVVAAEERGRGPGDPDPDLLARVAARYGHSVRAPAELLARAFDTSAAIAGRPRSGSVHPDAVRELLDAQAAELAALDARWTDRRAAAGTAHQTVDRLLAGEHPGRSDARCATTT